MKTVNKETVTQLDKTLSNLDAFDAMLDEQHGAIDRVADLLVSLESYESSSETASVAIADTLYGVLISQGEPCTIGWFNAVRLTWGDTYRGIKGSSLADNSVDKAWSRCFKMVSDAYGLEKPKSETVASVTKSTQRAKQAELLAAYEAVPVAELRDKAKALYNEAAIGDKVAKKEADIVVKAIDAKVKAEHDANKAMCKEIKSQIKELLNACDDFETLAEVLEILA